MVIVLLVQLAVTPAGNPEGVPIPVAPVVALVMAGDNDWLAHKVGVDEGDAAVFNGFTVTTRLLRLPSQLGVVLENCET